MLILICFADRFQAYGIKAFLHFMDNSFLLNHKIEHRSDTDGYSENQLNNSNSIAEWNHDDQKDKNEGNLSVYFHLFVNIQKSNKAGVTGARTDCIFFYNRPLWSRSGQANQV